MRSILVCAALLAACSSKAPSADDLGVTTDLAAAADAHAPPSMPGDAAMPDDLSPDDGGSDVDAGTIVTRLSVSGAQILDPSGSPIVLRGYNWGNWDVALATDAADNVAQGANVVRIPLSWYFAEGVTPGTGKQDAYSPGSPGNIDPSLLAIVDQQVAWATAQHLWVDVMVRGGDNDFWTNPVVIPQFIEMWTFLANRYKNTPYIGAFELLSEPHPTNDEHNNALVTAFYEQVIAGIRTVDQRTPVIVGAAKDYEVRSLEQVYLADQTNVIYAANFYELPAYVKELGSAPDGGVLGGYPGPYFDQVISTDTCDTQNVGQTVTMDKTFLSGLLGCATSFGAKHSVPVFIDQVGIRTGTPDSMQYVTDVLDLFDKSGTSFTYWTYRSGYDKSSLGPDDISMIYQTEDGVWHEKDDWIALVSSYFTK